MIKKENSKKLVQRTFTLHPRQIECIEHVMEEEGVTSISDAVRRMLEGYHKKAYPDYIWKLTPGQEEKKREMEKDKELDAMPDEDFAIQTFHSGKSDIVSNGKGEKFVLIHYTGNSLKPIPLANIKKWTGDTPDMVKYHLDKLKNQTVENALNVGMKQALKMHYGIVFE